MASETEFGTVIGADATFKGDFKFGKAAKVLGRIEGSITSEGVVHVASGSKCKAQIIAAEIAIEGAVEGNVEASDRVEIRPQGKITGDITAAKMTMADGASIDGYIRIGMNGKAKTATEVKPEATATATASARATAAKK